MREFIPKAFKVLADRVEIYGNVEGIGEPEMAMPIWVINQIAAALVMKYDAPLTVELTKGRKR